MFLAIRRGQIQFEDIGVFGSRSFIAISIRAKDRASTD